MVVAQLTEYQLAVLQELEKQTGRYIVALTGTPLGHVLPAVLPASLSEDELNRLQKAEKDLGLTLVALDAE